MHIMIGYTKITIKPTHRDMVGATFQYPDGTVLYAEYDSVKDVLEAAKDHKNKK